MSPYLTETITGIIQLTAQDCSHFKWTIVTLTQRGAGGLKAIDQMELMWRAVAQQLKQHLKCYVLKNKSEGS